MKNRPLPRIGLAVAALAAGAGAGWVVFGSAATLSVTPKNASAFRTCVLTAYPTSSTVMSDSWVDEQSPSSGHGTLATSQVESRSSKNTRAFLRFDVTNKCVPAIAGTATVTTATLRLTLATAPSASRTYNLNRVTTPCPESATTCWTENNITWNNQPAVVGTATSTLALSSSSTSQYYGFDVTADVAAFVAGTASNYGWRISDSVESAGGSGFTSTFKSKEALLDSAGAPELVVVYTP